jgi:hypothetical protein
MYLRVGFTRLALVLATTCALGLVGASPATAADGAVRVQGAHLVRDGSVWLPRGVQIVGLVAPAGSLTGRYVDANAHFGLAELEAARAAHADVIRFQVSQYGLDPEDPLYSPGYVHEVQNAVELARGLGLTAIVSLQAETPAGRDRICPLPDAGAERAWQQLAPMFAGDPGVLLELFNEPSLLISSANWQLWQYGGLVTMSDGSTCEAVGMQTLIDDIRADGATNVIIVPGLGGETTLEGMPTLTDPASPLSPQLAYGIHYPSLAGGVGRWDAKFGNASASVPVIVTEWYANTTHLCTPDEPARAASLLTYLATKQIGVVGYAFDVPGTIVADWSYAPTTYAGFACGPPGDGPGRLLLGEFAGLSQADGPTLDDPQGWVIDYSAVDRLDALAPGLVRHFFDNPRAFVIGPSVTTLQRLGIGAAIPTASFTSETALARAVTHHALPFGTRAVIFDDEHWKRTPLAEQLNPAVYYRRAAQIAHAHGLLLVAAPSPDLVQAKRPRMPGTQTYAAFLDRRIAAGVARSADVYDVQAQGLETQGPPYASFVQAAALQAAASHPDIELLAGISTDSLRRQRGPSVLLDAVGGAGATVSGYWLNDPPGSQLCPGCAGRYDATAIAFLRALKGEGY